MLNILPGFDWKYYTDDVLTKPSMIILIFSIVRRKQFEGNSRYIASDTEPVSIISKSEIYFELVKRHSYGGWEGAIRGPLRKCLHVESLKSTFEIHTNHKQSGSCFKRH